MGEVKAARGVLQRGLLILHCLSKGSGDESVKSLSDQSGLDRATVHRLLQTLIQEGMVRQDPVTRRYGLHTGVLQLAGSLIHNLTRNPSVGGHLARLRDISGQSVGFHIRIDHQRLCTQEAESLAPLRMSSKVGVLYPLCSGAPGLAIIAFLDDEELERLLATPGALGPWEGRLEELRVELTRVRRAGYAISRGQVTPGACGIAAPVRDFRGQVSGAVNVAGSMATFLLDHEEEVKMARILMEASSTISRDSGYTS